MAEPLGQRLAALAAVCDGLPISRRQAILGAALGRGHDLGALSAAYDVCVAALAAGDAELFATALAAAALQMGAAPRLAPSVLAQLAHNVALPALAAAAAPLAALHAEVAAAFGPLLAQHGALALLAQLLDVAASSLAARCEPADLAAAAAAVAHAGLPSAAEGGARRLGVGSDGGAPPPPAPHVELGVRASCLLLQAVAAAADSAGPLPVRLLAAALPAGLALLSADGDAPAAAVRFVLPALLSAARAPGASPGGSAPVLSLVWRHAAALAGAPGAHRRAGLAALLALAPDWAAAEAAAAEAAAPGSLSVASAPPALDEPFWAALRACLADGDELTRKRAAALTRRLPPPPAAAAAPAAWAALLAMLGTLEEFAAHLVRAQWHALDALHPPASAPAAAAKAGGGAAEAAAPALPFAWMGVLWARALEHRNPQVSRAALAALCRRAWPPAALADVSPAFLADVLLPALLGFAHQRPSPGFSATVEVGALLRSWAAVAPAAAQRALFGRFTAAMASRALPRLGMQAALTAFAAAAEAATAAAGGGDASTASSVAASPSAAAAEAAAWRAGTLRDVRAALGVLQSYYGRAFKAANQRSLLELAARLCPLREPAAVDAAAALLADFPPSALARGGQLHDVASAWLGAGGDAVGAARVEGAFERCFYLPSRSPTAAAAAPMGREELAAWRAGAAQTAAMLLAAGGGVAAAAAGSAFATLEVHCRQVSSRPYVQRGVQERTLLLLRALQDAALSVAAAPPAPGAAPAADAAAAGPLVARAVDAVGETHQELCGVVQLASGAFWNWPEAPGSPGARASLALASLALGTAGSSLKLLLAAPGRRVRRRAPLPTALHAAACMHACAADSDTKTGSESAGSSRGWARSRCLIASVAGSLVNATHSAALGSGAFLRCRAAGPRHTSRGAPPAGRGGAATGPGAATYKAFLLACPPVERACMHGCPPAPAPGAASCRHRRTPAACIRLARETHGF